MNSNTSYCFDYEIGSSFSEPTDKVDFGKCAIKEPINGVLDLNLGKCVDNKKETSVYMDTNVMEMYGFSGECNDRKYVGDGKVLFICFQCIVAVNCTQSVPFPL